MQLKRFFVLLFSLTTLSNSAFSTDFDSPESSKQPGNYRIFIVTQIYHDFSYLIREKDFYYMMGGLYASPLILDDAFETESNGLGQMWGQSRFADNFFELGEVVGDVAFPAVASVTSWGFGKVSRSEKLQNFGYDLVRAQAMNGIMTVALKGAVHRTRPDGAAFSYPSGHTSSAFITAGVVYKHFGKAWGLPAFAMASFVGISRLQENKHYVSDVVAGAVLGTYISLKLAEKDTNGSSLSLSPYSYNHSTGLAMSLRF